ncbi:MAG: hypothetical protein U9R74_15010, partial [Pseudomonadota bacterium]|nr:hypothetical protein [Pseudomonadota bacterium]
MDRKARLAAIPWLMLLSIASTAIADTGRGTSAACAWSGSWTSSDGSVTQTLQLRGETLKGSYTLRDEECPQEITGSTRLTLSTDRMTASGTYHENDNRCWGASSGEIALALDAGANRIDFLVVDDEGEEFSDYMTRKPAAASPDCRPGNKISRSAGATAVKKEPAAKSRLPGGTGNVRAATRFVPYRIFDRDRNMVAAVIRIPADWQAQGNVIWSYQNASFPVRVEARAESQTGEVWVEGFPSEMFFWLEPDYQPMSNGVRKLGMIRQTPLSAEDALLHYVVIPARGNRRDFRVVNSRRISDLSRTFSDKPVSGQ